jgi:hypothetical protein
MMGMQATLRTYYLRGLEAELRKYVPEPLEGLGDLRPPSFMGLTGQLTSARRGRLALFALSVMTVVFLGLTAYITLNVQDMRLRSAMFVGYGLSTALIMTEVAMASAGGRSLFLGCARSFLRTVDEERLPKPRAAAAASVPTWCSRGLRIS